MSSNPSKAVARFYDRLSADYDAMTGSMKRLSQEEATFRSLVDRFKISSAIDAGCGTGFQSCLLARLGVDVAGVDVSPDMLAQAAARASQMGLSVTFVESTFARMRESVPTNIDAVFCLGNTLPHLQTRKDLLRSIKVFFAVLKKGGSLFLQLLNYDRILMTGARVQSVKEEGNLLFVRFYDFKRSRLRFNVLTLRRTAEGVQHSLDSVDLWPIRSSDVREFLSRVGFRKITLFGNARLASFDPKTSTDLFVVAMK